VKKMPPAQTKLRCQNWHGGGSGRGKGFGV
jgi:hypothetical protein